jgi:hypothetical protein
MIGPPEGLRCGGRSAACEHHIGKQGIVNHFCSSHAAQPHGSSHGRRRYTRSPCPGPRPFSTVLRSRRRTRSAVTGRFAKRSRTLRGGARSASRALAERHQGGAGWYGPWCKFFCWEACRSAHSSCSGILGIHRTQPCSLCAARPLFARHGCLGTTTGNSAPFDGCAPRQSSFFTTALRVERSLTVTPSDL